jgi:tetratricopeptide (TPR) repeat protein
MALLCQACGAPNPDDADFCRLCNAKLLVVSGRGEAAEGEAEDGGEESFSFDEHLLERISILEEAVKRTGETMRQFLSTVRKQERKILINHTGLAAVRELLEEKGLLGREEWSHLWKTKMDSQLLTLEKHERFVGLKERIAALYAGERRRVFLGHLEEAEHALAASDMERAVAALEEAFKLDRGNYELAYFLGEIHFNEGEPERALAYFACVLETRPDHYEGLVFSGVIRHQQGDNAGAEEFLQRGVALYPESFLPIFSLGAVYAAEGSLSRAVALLERAVAIDPLPQAQYLLGRCLYEMGRLGPAIAALGEAVRADPAFEEAHHLLGLAYLDRRWHKKALESFRAAQRLNPRKLRYHDVVRYLSGQLEAPLPEVGGEAARWLALGEKHLATDNGKRALPFYQKALAVEPANATLLLSYALLCLHLGRSEEIEAVTEKVLSGKPGEMLEATAYAMLIAALRSQGKLREGNRIGRRLVGEDRSDFTKTIAYYELAYNLAEMEEDLDQALDYARRSLELAPEELRQFPLAALGWVHYKRREYGRAVEFLARSSELGTSATTLTHLGMALLAAGEAERARAVLSQARTVADRGGALPERMMSWMKEGGQLALRARRRAKK